MLLFINNNINYYCY